MGPSLFQTGAEAEESGSFLCGEFVPQSSCSQICQMRFTFLHSVQADVPGLLKVARNGPRELDSVVSEIFLGFQAAKSR